MRNSTSDDSSYETNATSSLVSSEELRMESGSGYIPKDNPLKPEGEDAHFILAQLQTFGVADGVGGFAKHGIDSGQYSRALMTNAVLAIQNQEGPIDPRQALNHAVLVTQTEGAFTACILSLHNNNSLHAVNVGDSGLVQIRDGKIIYKSESQQRRFNKPYQLSYGSVDVMDSAQEIKRDVVAGDVIVVGTDGLFDNVHDEELEKLVRDGVEDRESPGNLAWKIAGFVNRQSQYGNICEPLWGAVFEGWKSGAQWGQEG